MNRQPSPLRSAKADAVPVCGRLLKRGQSMVVAESAIGARELKLAAKGKVRIIDAQQKGKKQIICLLP